jgi:hypothetical protein
MAPAPTPADPIPVYPAVLIQRLEGLRQQYALSTHKFVRLLGWDYGSYSRYVDQVADGTGPKEGPTTASVLRAAVRLLMPLDDLVRGVCPAYDVTVKKESAQDHPETVGKLPEGLLQSPHRTPDELGPGTRPEGPMHGASAFFTRLVAHAPLAELRVMQFAIAGQIALLEASERRGLPHTGSDIAGP